MLTESNFETLIEKISAETGNYLGGVYRQLRPIAWLNHLCFKKIWDINAHYILDGVFYGFHVIDPVLPAISYQQRNYSSCYVGQVEEKLSKLLWGEIADGKLSVVHNIPYCVHALGAIRKSTGDYRPITDCSMPEDLNNYMNDVFETFSFVKIEEILCKIEYGMWLSVVDLKAAYRSVAI